MRQYRRWRYSRVIKGGITAIFFCTKQIQYREMPFAEIVKTLNAIEDMCKKRNKILYSKRDSFRNLGSVVIVAQS